MAAHLAALTWFSLWHPLEGVGYQFYSGIGSDLEELTLLAGGVALFRKHNCQAPRCPRLGHHPTADGQFHLCRHHHPDLPDRRLTLAEIHARHHAARNERSRS